jgi:septum formation protein
MLKEKLANYSIILASGSPRRQQFFKELDINFSIQVKEVDEVFPENLKAQEITNYLAELKANAFNGLLSEKDILITSDTIVWLNNKAINKPSNKVEATQMLQALSNTTHEVITSVCFKTNQKKEVFHDVTKVTFQELSAEAIEYYIDNFQPFDKAGGYGIQDWIGIIGISKIEGSYANVVGMPIHLVYNKLLTFV